MLLLQHALGKDLRVVIFPNRYASLGDDRSGVEFRRDPVYARAVLGVAGFQRPGMRIQAAVLRKQRRVNVDHAPRVPLDEFGRQHAHETGQGNQFRPVAGDGFAQRRFEFGSPGKRSARQHRGVDGSFCGALEAGGRTVGDHGVHRDRQCPTRGGIDDRQRVAAAPGDQHDQPFAAHSPVYLTRAWPASSR